MQIHELNNYSGELGSSAYLAVDNGNDTGRVPVSNITDPINQRITEIITSPAPTQQEIIDARIGADGTLYPSLGDAIRDPLEALEADLDEFASSMNAEFVSIPLAMEKNGLDSSGSTTLNSTRARMVYSGPVDLACPTIKFPKGTKHRIYYYNGYNSGMVQMEEWSSALEEDLYFPTLSDSTIPIKFRLMVGYTDDRTITDDNIPIPKIEYFYNKNDGVPFVNGYYPQYSNPPAIRGHDANYNFSALIPVKPSTTYRANKFRVTILFDDKLHYTRVLAPTDIQNNQLTTGETEYYIAYCWKPADTDASYLAEADDFIGGAYIDNLVPVPLKGKYLSLLGDSISAYAGTIPSGYDAYYTGSNSGVDSPSQMWWSVLCDLLGMKPLVINGYSGSGVTQLEDSAHVSKIPMSSDERCSGLDDGTNMPDIIIIAGGVNDYSYAQSAQSEPLEWDGLTAPVLGNSFTEAYACMIKKLQTHYPNAIIVCLSTWFTMRGTDNGYTLVHTVGSNKYTQADYNKAIENVAKQMHVPYIDVSNIGFNRNNFYPTYAVDSATIPTHPNAAGQGVMGRAIANKLPHLVKGYTK